MNRGLAERKPGWGMKLRKVRLVRSFQPQFEHLETRCVPATAVTTVFQQTNIVSDQPGMAQILDANLVNAWGIGLNPNAGAFWVSDNGKGVTTLYSGGVNGHPFTKVPLTVTTPGGDPTGQVFNGTNDFVVSGGGNSGPAFFIFATESGIISGWNPNVPPPAPSTQAQTEITIPGAVFKGITLANNGQGNFLYAADFHGGTIDVFDKNFQMVTLAGKFKDPFLPAGFAPFNVASINGRIFVTYAKQDPAKHDDVPGAGNGFVDMFDTNGHFMRRIASRGVLNSPWGMVVAPSSFGAFANDVLVGNFRDGHINAYTTTGRFMGQLRDVTGQLLTIDGLWGLMFGNGVSAGDKNTLFFSAGPDGEQHGLFGSLSPVTTLARNAAIVSNLTTGPSLNVSTVPSNGDQNPYGVAFVPNDIAAGGMLHPGDILVSNFNNSTAGGNLQGTGTTIVDIDAQGNQSLFFPGQAGLGLTTALGVLKSGFVLVGSVPTTDGTSATVQNGSLLIIDKNGQMVANLSDSALLQGPWDLAINDQGSRAQVFVSNVLSGTISRINLTIPKNGNPVIQSITQIASGFAHTTDPNALVIGPTGLAFDRMRDVLYVASTADNAVFAIRNAVLLQSDEGMGRLIYQDNVHLHGPLGLVLAPNGDLIASNGDAVNPDPNNFSTIVEFTTHGRFVSQFQLGTSSGAAFGIALMASPFGVRFAAVNDAMNSLEVWNFGFPTMMA